MRRKSYWRRGAAAGALAALVAASACMSDRILSNDDRLTDGTTVSLAGRAEFAIRSGEGVQRVELPEWSLRGTVRNGRALADVAGAATMLRSIGEGDQLGPHGASAAAALIPLLAVRDDARSSASAEGRVAAHGFRHEGREWIVGTLFGPAGLPAAIGLFREGEVVSLARYEYSRVRNGWQTRSASLVTFREGRPASALIANTASEDRVTGPSVESLLGSATVLAAQVKEAAVWRRIADAMVPPLGAQVKGGCGDEWTRYFMTGAVMALLGEAAIAVCAAGPTPLCIGAVVAFMRAVEEWSKATKDLAKCLGHPYGVAEGGGGSGDYFGLTPPLQQSIEEKLKGLVDDCAAMLSCNVI